MKLSPICLFTFNRLKETKKTLQALQLNNLASKSELYIFSDGWKNDSQKNKILEVREFLNTVSGFKKITIIESNFNKGLANSIISGVTQVINNYGKVIVVEDDLITSSNFLDFMNNALNFYKENTSVFSISGYTMDLPSLESYADDYYIGVRASSWGWGTWSRSWIDIDWEIKDYERFIKSHKLRNEFRKGGSDMPRMLANQMNNKIDSWAIRWCYNQFKRKQYTIYPKVSKVVSIGFGSDATHTKKTTRFDVEIDKSDQLNFIFNNKNIVNNKLLREFKNKFSVLSRIRDKFL